MRYCKYCGQEVVEGRLCAMTGDYCADIDLCKFCFGPIRFVRGEWVHWGSENSGCTVTEQDAEPM